MLRSANLSDASSANSYFKWMETGLLFMDLYKSTRNEDALPDSFVVLQPLGCSLHNACSLVGGGGGA